MSKEEQEQSLPSNVWPSNTPTNLSTANENCNATTVITPDEQFK